MSSVMKYVLLKKLLFASEMNFSGFDDSTYS
jgi:hypothetical protein